MAIAKTGLSMKKLAIAWRKGAFIRVSPPRRVRSVQAPLLEAKALLDDAVLADFDFRRKDRSAGGDAVQSIDDQPISRLNPDVTIHADVYPSVCRIRLSALPSEETKNAVAFPETSRETAR